MLILKVVSDGFFGFFVRVDSKPLLLLQLLEQPEAGALLMELEELARVADARKAAASRRTPRKSRART